MNHLKITVCPSCGSKKIEKVKKVVSGTRGPKRYSVPGVEFYECPDCGERVFDPQAIRLIEKHSTSITPRKSTRKIA